ncbi:MAG TPA: IclR family transcriptional regulator [Gaiellaceae bacterium]|nr:IclR family transcriptional regulator [Gaiellaceae bacterium]
MVQSVERAFAILDALAGRTAGLTALAARVGLPKSTVARLLQTLQRLGAVERVDGARWRIGPGVAALAAGASAERGLAALVRPELVSLVADLGEDAGLALPDGYDVHYIDQVESENPVQVRDWTGTRAPMHAAPSGLVLLAEWPEDAIAGYLRRDLERLTPATVVDPARLRARLAEVRRRGYAWGLQEFAEGINSVAAPVRDARGQAIAAIHAHGPAYRFPPPGGEDRIAARIAAAADAVHGQLALDAA